MTHLKRGGDGASSMQRMTGGANDMNDHGKPYSFFSLLIFIDFAELSKQIVLTIDSDTQAKEREVSGISVSRKTIEGLEPATKESMKPDQRHQDNG